MSCTGRKLVSAIAKDSKEFRLRLAIPFLNRILTREDLYNLTLFRNPGHAEIN